MAAVTQPLTGSAAGEASCPVVGVVLKDLESGTVLLVLGTELHLCSSVGVLVLVERFLFLRLRFVKPRV